MRPLLLPYVTPGLSLIAGWCVSGATPEDQPWMPVLPENLNLLPFLTLLTLASILNPILLRCS
jgi:hypothetical protein